MGWFSVKKCRSEKKLDGQVAIVTGSNTGIGKFTALDLARRGAHVVMACRNLERAEAAAADIRKEVPDSKLEVKLLDLSSLESVREFCKEFSSSHTSLNLLINNAGMISSERWLTVDGLEMQFAANYLGHFLLTLLLLPIIVKSAPSRIINVSSTGHKFCKSMYFEDLNLEQNFSPSVAYGRSKLAQIMFSQELCKRLEGKDVKVVSLHPGAVKTDIARNATARFSVVSLFWIFTHFGGWLLRTPEQGAQTILYCALEDSVESGLYYDDCAVCAASETSRNSELAQELWDKSLELVKISDFELIKRLLKE